MFHRAEIVDADEVFITNSIQEIVPLKTMEGRKLPGLNGAIVTLLQGYINNKERIYGVEIHFRRNSMANSVLQCGSYTLDYSRKTLIMGILNITPDSFSDGGKYNQLEGVVERAKELVEAGADIIDIGGESTRPGYEEISVEEEIARVVPAIEAIVKEVRIPLSIDTYKAEVAKHALEAGAHIINDIWGAKR